MTGKGTTINGWQKILEDERQHSPEEFFRLSSFRRAQIAWGMLIERMIG